MNHPAKILVIIPCYNEEANIVSTVERLRATCPQVDFLIINDCSTDRSAELLAEHGYPFLDLPVNLGIGGGVQCGCGSSDYGIHVRRDAVDLTCSRCGARLRIPAATDEDLDRLCCQMKLVIPGK